MALKLDFSSAEKERVKLTKAQEKQIKELYENVSKQIAKEAEKIPDTVSGALRQQYLHNLQRQVNDELRKISSQVEDSVKGNMKKTAEAVVDDNIDFLKAVGMPVEGAFSRVPDDVVRAVATGQVYEGKWSLSRALWKNTQRTQKDVESVVAQGIAQNKSAYAIAKDLEKYVDPNARKDWNWSKVYPGTARKVDYNAQRLARTLVSHAYQQSFVKTTQKNPFVTKYKWVSAGGARTCEICAGRDGQYYSKTDLPLDHPNGMCTYIAVIEDSMVDIADRIADWANGKPDPELDAWAKDLGSKAPRAEQPVAKNPDNLSPGALSTVGPVTRAKSIEQAATSANPNYNPREYKLGTHTNCAYCSTAVDMMLRGYTVAANERVAGEPVWSWQTNSKGQVVTGKGHWTDCFKGITYQNVGATRVTQCVDKVSSVMNSYGPNSRGVVFVQWKTGGGHYFNVVNDNGSVRFIDGQNSSLDCTSYFSKVKPSSVAVFRTDNCPITDYASKVVHRND